MTKPASVRVRSFINGRWTRVSIAYTDEPYLYRTPSGQLIPAESIALADLPLLKRVPGYYDNA